MAFIDEITVYIRAGRGGNGVVRWRHIKGKDLAGPSGGDGGRGGSVYVEGTRDMGALSRYRNIKEFRAENGEEGKSNSMHGKNGEDLIIELPIGSVITNTKSGYSTELLEVGERKLLLSGGRGGFGNERFKSSVNRSPKEWKPGENGEEGNFRIELHLFADGGLIGLPNAGKSSLLNSLTKSKAKVGEYQFTTLEPNLGELYGFVLADIPGLIEGASEGKGLGHKFLKHVNRTRALLHCISLESLNIEKDYKVVRGELSKYSKELSKKPEIIILTKADVLKKSDLAKAKAKAKKLNKNVFVVSILDDELVKNLGSDIAKTLSNL